MTFLTTVLVGAHGNQELAQEKLEERRLSVIER